MSLKKNLDEKSEKESLSNGDSKGNKIGGQSGKREKKKSFILNIQKDSVIFVQV